MRVPNSYALAGPYAGDDARVCQGVNFEINTATSLYDQSLQWTTSGDGTFIDPTLLKATYEPGEGDVAAGTVILTLSQSVGDFVLTDEVELVISGIPFVYAGNDTTITRQDDFYTVTANAAKLPELTGSAAGMDYLPIRMNLTPRYPGHQRYLVG